MISTLTFNASQTLHKVNFTGKCYNFIFKESRRMKSFHACSLIHVDVYVAVANMPSYTALLHKQTPCIIFMLQGRGPRKNDYITPCTRVCVNLSKYLDCKNNTVMIFTGFFSHITRGQESYSIKKNLISTYEHHNELRKTNGRSRTRTGREVGAFQYLPQIQTSSNLLSGCCRRGTTLFED